MAQTIRVSLSGVNALTDSDVRNYALFADSDNVLIKEKARGSSSVNNGATLTVAHGLSYTPHVFVYTETATAGRYKLSNGYDVLQPFTVYVDGTNLKVTNNSGATRTVKYFIFYDNIG